MTNRCSVVQVAVSLWSPHGDDLPDDVAEHLESCPRCMAAFDARFAPWSPPADAPAPPQHRRLSLRMLPLAAAAAMGLLMVPGVSGDPSDGSGGVAWAFDDESPLTIEEQLAVPECLQLDDLDHPFCEDSEWL